MIGTNTLGKAIKVTVTLGVPFESYNGEKLDCIDLEVEHTMPAGSSYTDAVTIDYSPKAIEKATSELLGYVREWYPNRELNITVKMLEA